ncbi:protein-tyrosine-phosphatase [Chryseolinea sp. H1M3-3]|uniref:protein-tyrosine-phosphatase n=1 Tax=Chryseolinea sp. H1M3-3 TaxID=3034144 RepID=UPI0023ECB163|nr:protein-tyrosine-phosphatase [Chryseolinea sp. H1M3-3]
MPPQLPKAEFYKPLENTINTLINQFDTIPDDRKVILKQLTDFIKGKQKSNQKIELIFICTHNSRRSHISQLWAQTAAAYYGVGNLVSYSGGTEATAFNPRAVKAMKDAGFKINATTTGDNPVYEVQFSDVANEVIAYSKKYDAATNPKKGFAAIMTCSHADENCPVVFGMEKRISLPYNDPKDFDGTPQEAAKYSERVMEIGKEILFAFSQVNG